MSKHERFAVPPPERTKRIMTEMAAAGAKKVVVGTREKFLAKCGDLPSCRVDMPEDIAELDRRIEDMERRARFFHRVRKRFADVVFMAALISDVFQDAICQGYFLPQNTKIEKLMPSYF